MYYIPQSLINFQTANNMVLQESPTTADDIMSTKLFQVIDTGQNTLDDETDTDLITWIKKNIAEKKEDYMKNLLYTQFIINRSDE